MEQSLSKPKGGFITQDRNKKSLYINMFGVLDKDSYVEPNQDLS